jgi:hypothetical protein
MTGISGARKSYDKPTMAHATRKREHLLYEPSSLLRVVIRDLGSPFPSDKAFGGLVYGILRVLRVLLLVLLQLVVPLPEAKTRIFRGCISFRADAQAVVTEFDGKRANLDYHGSLCRHDSPAGHVSGTCGVTLARSFA